MNVGISNPGLLDLREREGDSIYVQATRVELSPSAWQRGNVSNAAVEHALKFMVAMRGTSRLSSFFGISELTATTSYGTRFRFRLGDYIDRIVLQDGYYKSEILEALRRDLPPGAVVWDVGANFGLHAITLKVLRPDIRVICFEPSPDLTARIAENARLNDVTVEVHCVGLGGEEAVKPLHIVSQGNPGMTTFVPWDQAHYTSTILSRIAAGDAWIGA